MVKGKTIISTANESEIYSHDLQTDSILINVCNTSHCDDRTDRTSVTVKTMYGDYILINQLEGWISINGTKIQLKGSRVSSARPEVIFAHSTVIVKK